MQSNSTKIQSLVIELEKIRTYLEHNNHKDDALRIAKIISDITDDSFDRTRYNGALKRFIAMSGIRYLGDIMISEFDSPYEWMNYLSEVAELAKVLLTIKN